MTDRYGDARAQGEGPRFPAVGSVVRAVPWLLACCGVVVSYLLLSALIFLGAGHAVAAAIRTLGRPAPNTAAVQMLDLTVQVAVQLGCAAAFGLWWRYLKPGAFAPRRRRPLHQTAHARAARLAGIALLGVALQLVISLALTLLVVIFPQAIEEYGQIMEASGTNDFSLLAVIVLSLGAPLMEEVMCRGVLLEFALRAVCPGWRAGWRRIVDAPTREEARARVVPPARFWAANVLQAALFGLLHGNVVQSSYAFVVGLILGAVFWRTGRFRYNMALHAVINFASFGVDALWRALAPFGIFTMLAVLVGACVLAGRLFRRGTEPFAGLLPAASERSCR